MFENATLTPPDAIFGVNELYKNDANENKINLTIGVYKDDAGHTPLMQAVADAEQILLDAKSNKSYLPIDGLPAYNEEVGKMLLGPVAENVHWASTQTPGGTGALRVAGELLKSAVGVDSIWMSDPTWANHAAIFGNAGFNVHKHDYLDQRGVAIDFAAMKESLKDAKSGEAILLHGVCHNPTGVDPTESQWEELLSMVADKGLLPVFDFAYQGFGEGLDADAAAIRKFLADGKHEVLICNSFSKNFGLYGERVGGLTVVSQSKDASAAMQSQVKSVIRRIYSNPPTHGAAIVSTILHDDTLRKSWQAELAEMRIRIKNLRSAFVAEMKRLAPDRDFEFINDQKGMFSYSGLSGEAATRLREEHSIYILNSGRINVAGISPSNCTRICEAVAGVI